MYDYIFIGGSISNLLEDHQAFVAIKQVPLITNIVPKIVNLLMVDSLNNTKEANKDSNIFNEIIIFAYPGL